MIWLFSRALIKTYGILNTEPHIVFYFLFSCFDFPRSSLRRAAGIRIAPIRRHSCAYLIGYGNYASSSQDDAFGSGETPDVHAPERPGLTNKQIKEVSMLHGDVNARNGESRVSIIAQQNSTPYHPRMRHRCKRKKTWTKRESPCSSSSSSFPPSLIAAVSFFFFFFSAFLSFPVRSDNMQNRRGKTGNATGRSSYFRNSFARIWCVRRCIIITSEFLNPADCERTVFTKAFVGQIFQFFERWKWPLKQLQCFFVKKRYVTMAHTVFS